MSEVLPKAGFQSPYDVPTPAGAEGWEEMYPYYLLFDPERREQEESRFWFYNGMHFPEPMPAFDMITGGSCYQSIGLYQGRVFSIPTVLGIEHRVVNGYIYITSNEVTDPAEIEKRLEVFLPRIGFYYANWDSLVNRWQAEVDKRIEELATLEVPKLPELEDEQEVIHDHKLGSNYRLMRSYDRTLQLYNELNQLHFELLLLAYGAYLTFFQFCQGAFPDMGMQTMTQMIAGYDTTMFRPDDELKALARSALDKGVDGVFSDGRSARGDPRRAERVGTGPRVDRRPRVAAAPMVLHVHRRRLLPPPPGVGRRPETAVRCDRRVHPAARRGPKPRAAEGAAARRARPDRLPSTRRCWLPTRSARSSTRCSGSAATSFPTRKGTSSSSSTGAPRSSSTRCARSARSSSTRASSRRQTTSSSSTSTRCTRPSSTSASPGPAASRAGEPCTGRRGWHGGRRSSRSSQSGTRRPRSGRCRR